MEVAKEADKTRSVVVDVVENNGHVKQLDANSVEAESNRTIAKACNETIVVNVEVHEPKDT